MMTLSKPDVMPSKVGVHVVEDVEHQVLPYMWRKLTSQLVRESELERKLIAACANDMHPYEQMLKCLEHFESDAPRFRSGPNRKRRARNVRAARDIALAFVRKSKILAICATSHKVEFHHSLNFPRSWSTLVTVYFDSHLMVHSFMDRVETSFITRLPDAIDLLRCGDIESNPGPGMSKMSNPELVAREKALKKQVSISNRTLKKKQAQLQRVTEHIKDRRGKSRKEARAMKEAVAEGFLSNISECASAGSEHLRPVLNALHAAIGKIGDLADRIRLPALKGDFDLMAFVTSVVSVISGLMTGSMVTTSINVIHLAKLVGLDSGVLEGWLHVAAENEETTNTAEAAAAEGDDGDSVEADGLLSKARVKLVSLFSFICNFFSALCGKVPTAAAAAVLLTTIGRASMGWRSIYQAAQWLHEKLSDTYYRCVYGLTADEYKLSQRYPELEELYAASKMVAEIPKAVIDGSTAVCAQITSLGGKLEDVSQLAAKSRDERFMRFISAMKTTIRTNLNNARNSPAAAKFMRSEPFAIYMYGKPGVGKSVLLDIMKADIYQKLLKADERPTSLDAIKFTRLTTNEYWEGYTGQPIVVMDDFGCLADNKLSPNEDYVEALRIINAAPYPLHMANLNEKANTFFTSPYFMVTTNQRVPPVTSLNNPDALYRRFHMYIDVKCRPNYGVAVKEGTDVYHRYNAGVAKEYCAQHEMEYSALMTDQYEIDVYEVNPKGESTVIAPGLTYDQFWRLFVKNAENHRAKNGKLEEAFHKRAGTTPTPQPQTEREVLQKFADIFNLETLVESVVEATTETFADAESEDADPVDFLSAEPAPSLEARCQGWWDKIAKWRKSAHDAIVSLLGKLKQAATATGTLAVGLASLIYNIVSCAVGKFSQFGKYVGDAIMDHPWISAFGVCLSLALAYVGYRWWRKSSTCSFAQYPSLAQSPCRKCDWCQVVDFPPTGDMMEHLAMRVSNPEMCERLAELAEVEPSVFASRVLSSVCAQGRVYNGDVRRKAAPSVAEALVAHTPISVGSTAYAEGGVVFVEQLQATMVKNAVRLESIGTNGKVSRANGVFLRGRVALTTYHTLVPVDFVVKSVRIRNPYAKSDSIEVPISELSITQCTDATGRKVDLALVTFSGLVPNRRNIISRFVPAKDIPSLSEGEAVLVGFDERGGALHTEEQCTQDFRVHLREMLYSLHGVDKCPFNGNRGACVCAPARVASHISYKIQTGPGKCGSLVAVRGAPTQSCIIGMHVAGGSVAYASALTQEFLLRNLDAHVRSGGTYDDDLIDGAIPYAQGLVNDVTVPDIMMRGGDCLAIGVAPHPHVPTKTVLRPSLVHSALQKPITRPAVLRAVPLEGKLIDPMYKGMDKVMQPQTFIQRHLVDIAVKDVFAMFPRENPRVLTYEESIAGVVGDPYMRPVNRTSSPGYPYNLSNPGKGKRAWLGEGETYIFNHPGLRTDVLDLLEKGKRLERGSAISIATLKDERRPHEKVDAAKTRVFEACPMHLVLAIRMYYLSFAASVMRNRVECESCVGVNPYSSEWTNMAIDLLARGDCMVAGDFSNYDGSLLYQVLIQIGRAINDWYDDGEENANIRASLWEHISCADVLVRGAVVRQTHSQPSGNPLTVIINSIYNSVIMRIAYLHLKAERGQSVMCDFRVFVKMMSYGDDNVLSISPLIIEWFNQMTISKALEKVGMVYTTEDKSEAVAPYKSLSETTFLKRSFRDAGNGWFLAPMSVENILEMTNWIRGKQQRMRTLENCEFALMELSYHEQHVYDRLSRAIRNACDEVGISLRVPTYAEWSSQHMYDMAYYETHPYVPMWSCDDEPTMLPAPVLGEDGETVRVVEADSPSENGSPTLQQLSATAEGDICTATIDEQNIPVDTMRGQILSDIQSSVNETPMDSTTTVRALRDETEHDIRDLLERPVVLGHYSWSTTDSALSPSLSKADYDADTQNYLKKWDFPQAIFDASPLIVEKAKNFQYFKSDVEIEVKVNAQPFMAGALALVYNPYYDYVSDFRRKGTRFLASQTSCPYKMLSLENGNSMKLTCPYANVKDLFDLDDPEHQFGTVFLYCIADLLSSTEPDSVSYTVLARFVNPKFRVPTHRDVLAKSVVHHQVRNLERRGWRVDPPVAEGEQTSRDSGETKQSGPITTISNVVSTAAGALSSVPVIGDIASSVAWVARAVGGVASVFGWSKPARADAHEVRTIKPAFSLIHTEGYDDSITMALLQDNGIDGSSMIPSSKDEMTLDYIFRRPNIFYRDTVDSITFKNQSLLLKWEVSPFTQYQHLDSVNSEALYLGSFAYASMQGTLWTGEIIYDIYFIKTCFHQGRVAIVYLPETNMADVPTTLGELLTTNYAKIVNLREIGSGDNLSVVRIPVPYISNVPWKRTVLFDGNGDPASGTTETTTGCLAMYALTDLSAPDTVGDGIQILLAHSGGKDYEVSRPLIQLCPGYDVAAADDREMMLHEAIAEGEIRSEGATAEGDIGEMVIPDSEDPMVPDAVSRGVCAQTTGEYFKSFRAYMKRCSPFALYSSQATSFTGLKPHLLMEGSSGHRILRHGDGSGKALVTPFYAVSFLYRFWNGSTVIKIPGLSLDSRSDVYLSIDSEYTNAASDTNLPINGMNHVQRQTASGMAEYRIPYYQDVRCGVVSPKVDNPVGSPRLHVQVNGNYSTVATRVFEGAGDDFNFFFLVGPPPMRSITKIDSPAELPFPAPTIHLDSSPLEGFAAVDGLDGEPYYDIYPLTGPQHRQSGVRDIVWSNKSLWGKNSSAQDVVLSLKGARLVYNHINDSYAIRVPAVHPCDTMVSFVEHLRNARGICIRVGAPGLVL